MESLLARRLTAASVSLAVACALSACAPSPSWTAVEREPQPTPASTTETLTVDRLEKLHSAEIFVGQSLRIDLADRIATHYTLHVTTVGVAEVAQQPNEPGGHDAVVTGTREGATFAVLADSEDSSNSIVFVLTVKSA